VPAPDRQSELSDQATDFESVICPINWFRVLTLRAIRRLSSGDGPVKEHERCSRSYRSGLFECCARTRVRRYLFRGNPDASVLRRSSAEPLRDGYKRSPYHASLRCVAGASLCSASRHCLRRASSLEYRRALTKSWPAIAATMLRMARSRCFVASSRLRTDVVTNAEPDADRLRSTFATRDPKHPRFALNCQCAYRYEPFGRIVDLRARAMTDCRWTFRRSGWELNSLQPSC
jgi:hypothetical protein